MSLFRNPATKAEFIFGQKMRPCPACNAYDMMYQTPIKMAEEIEATDDVKTVLGKWARSYKRGDAELEGPVFIMCRSCGHKGPSVDCSGMTSNQVMRSGAVAGKARRLWNTQQKLKEGVK